MSKRNTFGSLGVVILPQPIVRAVHYEALYVKQIKTNFREDQSYLHESWGSLGQLIEFGTALVCKINEPRQASVSGLGT